MGTSKESVECSRPCEESAAAERWLERKPTRTRRPEGCLGARVLRFSRDVTSLSLSPSPSPPSHHQTRLAVTRVPILAAASYTATMSQYAAAVPQNAVVRPEIKHYFESFYAISDTPDAHEKYSQQFTKNAKLIMASNEANGRDGRSKVLSISLLSDAHEWHH